MQEGLKADDVERITVKMTDDAVKHSWWLPYEPVGLTAAQMHLGFCIAMKLIDGEVFVDQMVEENMGRPDLLAFASGWTAERDEEREKKGRAFARGADVEVLLKDGRVMRKVVDNFLGSWQKPMSDEQMAQKYRRLAAKSLSPEAVNELERLVRTWKTEPAAGGLVRILQGEQPRAAAHAPAGRTGPVDPETETTMHADAPVRHPDKFFIDGQWTSRPAPAGSRSPIPPPRNCSSRWRRPRKPTSNRAVAAARKAFDHGPWPRMSHDERAQAHARDGGRAGQAGRAARAHLDHGSRVRCTASPRRVARASATTTCPMPIWPTSFPFQERHKPKAGGEVAMLVREPVGVVAAIVPWNAAPGAISSKVGPGADCRLHGHRQGVAGSARLRLHPGRGLRGRRLARPAW